ncbi:MAG TPA: 30S ribosomal protein S3 [candidate division WWE3 bacterium]|uniref:Small ribosomal subunit protein uS3 n=1 Tax=candidate division WWE3 bacterium TaxID=2053526 RepID=A0A7C1DNZ9_UNCKA|nr:30S ribosomal protein S3 [candidate division WWE3 bacterium]
MGQKVNPYGFRLGITQDWKSKWFAPKENYAEIMLEDHKIRKYISNQLASAGLKEVEINRAVNELTITLRVSRPGMVIGRKGTGIQQIEHDLHEMTKSKVKLNVEEVKVPELEATLVADYISHQMKRRLPYRRVVKTAVRSAMDKGAKGIKIRVSGVLSGGNTIARTEVYGEGSIPTQTLRANIDYAQLDCDRLFGIIGIKVWIYKGEMGA